MITFICPDCKDNAAQFTVHQDSENIKIMCSNCQQIHIIAWQKLGHIKNLKTGHWVKAKARVIMEETL